MLQLSKSLRPAIAGLFTVLFSGCGQKEPAIASAAPAVQSPPTITPVLLEAKYADLPVPVGFSAQSSAPLRYVGTLAITQVRDFYHKQMERLGWVLEDFSHESEGLLICRKPSRTCVISLRVEDGSTSVVLFTDPVSAPATQRADVNEKPIPGE